MSTRYKANKSMMRGLEKRAQQLQQQHSDLQAQRGTLLLREQLLRAFCAAMAALQQRSSGGQLGCDDVMSEEALQQLLHAEGDLLQQLQGQPQRQYEPPQPQPHEQLQQQVQLSDPLPDLYALPEQERDASQQPLPDVQQLQQDSGSGGGSVALASSPPQQPQPMCRSGSCTSGSTHTSGGNGALPTMAPPEEPLAFFYRNLRAPPEPDAATLSVQDMASRLRSTTLELSVQLHRLGSGPRDKQAETLEKMWALWDRYAGLLLSIVLVGRMDVADSVNAMDMATLLLDTEGANSQDGRMADMVHTLKLSPQQSARIAEGLPVAMSLLQAVQRERTALQAEVASLEVLSVADDAACGSPSASGSNGFAISGGSEHAGGSAQQQEQQQQQHLGSGQANGDGGSASARLLHPISCRQQQLQVQHARLIRLQQLLAKEYVLRTTACFWFIGCLDVSQATRAAVLSWPYFWRPMLLAAEVCKCYEREQQQRKPKAP